MWQYNYSNDELYHYGVLGMKWGKRKANPYGSRALRGHAGPGIYLTKNSQKAGDARDLKTLSNGGHLSVGLTKKRQAMFDARDKAAIEKRQDSSTSKSFKSAAAAHEAKTQARDKARQEKVSSAGKKLSEKIKNQQAKNIERKNNALDHPAASSAVQRAKVAALSGIGALGTAAVGSAATYALARAGKKEAAHAVYTLSRQTFNSLSGMAAVSTVASAVSASMSSREAIHDYIQKDREIIDRYK